MTTGTHTDAQVVKDSNTPARSEGNCTTQVAETEELVQDTRRHTERRMRGVERNEINRSKMWDEPEAVKTPGKRRKAETEKKTKQLLK